MKRKVIDSPSKDHLSILSADNNTLASQLRTVGKKTSPQSLIYFSEPNKIAVSKVAGKIRIPGISVADHCDCICHCDCANCLCDCSCTVCSCGSCDGACVCDCNCNPVYCDCSVCNCDCDCITPDKSEQILEASRQLVNSLSKAKKAVRFGDMAQILGSIRRGRR
jgi:hypothetical protein